MLDIRRFHQLLISFAVVLSFLAIRPLAAEEKGVPLSLKQYTDMALQNSLRSRTAEETLASGRWGWLAARRGLTWPSATASVSQSKSFSDTDTGTTTDTRDREETLNLKQPILTGASLSLSSNWSHVNSVTDISGGTIPTTTRYLPNVSAGFTQPLFLFVQNPSLRARRQANLLWNNAQDAYWSERLNIEFDARALYYNLLLEAETTAVERKKFESASLVNEVTRALVRAGKLAEVELVRAEIRSKTDQRNIQNSENNLEKAMNSAKDLISLPSNQNIRLVSKLTYDPFTITLDKILKAAAENNPGLQTAKRQVELAEIDLQQAREADRPQLNTSGSYALTRNRSNPDLPIDPHSWTLMAGVSWTFFDATQTRLRTRQSETALHNTKRSHENQLRQLNIAVENAYLEIKRTESQISDFEPQRESAERNVRAIRLQYKNGLTRLTDVFDAENQLRNLELEYLGLLKNFNTERDRLKVLVGTDLNEVVR